MANNKSLTVSVLKSTAFHFFLLYWVVALSIRLTILLFTGH
jgi:hypothetical protein